MKKDNEEEELTLGQKVFWFMLGLIIISIIHPIMSPFIFRP